MQLLTEQEIALVSGGEVGATGMGDDWHYTGDADKEPKDDSWGRWIKCMNKDAQACLDIFWTAMGK